MNFKKFTIINHNDAQQSDEIIDILINTDHIVSIKPIKMTTNDQQVLEGFWIRLTNGKKYKAIQMSENLKKLLNEKLPHPDYISEDNLDSIQ
jgi:hypothetical protein